MISIFYNGMFHLFFFFYRNKSNTLAIESHFNYTAVDIAPNGSVLVAINESEYMKCNLHLILSLLVICHFGAYLAKFPGFWFYVFFLT